MLYTFTKTVEGTDVYLNLEISVFQHNYIKQSYVKRLYEDYYRAKKVLPSVFEQKVDNEMYILGFIYLLAKDKPVLFEYKWFEDIFGRGKQAIETYFKDNGGKTMDNFTFNYEEGLNTKERIMTQLNKDHYTISKMENESLQAAGFKGDVLLHINVKTIHPALLEMIKNAYPSLFEESSTVEEQSNVSNTISLSNLSPKEIRIVFSFYMKNINSKEIVTRFYAITGKIIDESEVQSTYDEHFKPGADFYNKIMELKEQYEDIFTRVYEEKYTLASTQTEFFCDVLTKPLIEDTDLVQIQEPEKPKKTKQRLNYHKRKELKDILYPLFIQGYDENDAMIYCKKHGIELTICNAKNIFEEWVELFIKDNNLECGKRFPSKRKAIKKFISEQKM